MNTKEQIELLSKRQHEYDIKHDMIIKKKAEYEKKRIKEQIERIERLTFSYR